eukprot:IDg2190t1
MSTCAPWLSGLRFVVVLQTVGARGQSPGLHKFRIAGAVRVRVTSDTHDSAEAAILNAIDFFWVSDEDKQVAVEIGAASLATEKQKGLVFQSFVPLGEAMNKMQRMLNFKLSATVQARKLGHEAHIQMRNGSRMVAFEWLARKTNSVYIARLQQDPIVDHAICIDASRGIILDSEERFP